MQAKNRSMIIRTLGFLVAVAMALAILLALTPQSVEFPYRLEVFVFISYYSPMAIMATIVAAHGGAGLIPRIHVRLLLSFVTIILVIAGIQITIHYHLPLLLVSLIGLICFINARLAVVWLANRSWWYVQKPLR
jgi:hypothetical protein